MIRAFVERLLGWLGLRITRVPRRAEVHQPERDPATPPAVGAFLDRFREDPLGADLHFELAVDAHRRGRPFLAYAELKTAELLGADPARAQAHAALFAGALPELRSMSHNNYFRLTSLASEIRAHAGGAPALSVLDVGGGEGELAAFLRGFSYCLAEPRVNGMSGRDLPFADRSFDFVVACHVLEHVPVVERWPFLDQLVAKARRGVILLNPFDVEGTFVEERLRLFIEVTGAQWAREHLGCTLPKVQDIRDYAARRGLSVHVEPNGTVATSTAFVFLDHFAARAGLREDWRKVNAFFNERYTNILDSPEYPTAYLVHLGLPAAGDEAGAP